MGVKDENSTKFENGSDLKQQTERKQILIISQYWFPEENVPQRRMAWFQGILEEAGYEVQLFAPSTKPRSGSLHSIRSGAAEGKHFRFRPDQSKSALGIRVFGQAVFAVYAAAQISFSRFKKDSYHPDLIIGTVPTLPIAIATRLAASCHRIPYVIDLRDAWPHLLSDVEEWNDVTADQAGSAGFLAVMKRVGTPMVRKSLLRSYAAASALFVTSESLAFDLRNRFICTNLPIFLIRNVFPSIKMEKQISIPDSGQRLERLNVLYAGTLGRAQDLRNALVAASLVGKAGESVKLRLVGEGAAKNDLETLANDLNIEVEFVERKSLANLRADYEWAHTALVHLRRWNGLEMTVPSKTYELMRCGIHISAVAEGETAELIRSTHSGFVAPPGDPQALADSWLNLIRDPRAFHIGPEAGRWVSDQEASSASNLCEAVGGLIDGA